MPKLVLGAAAAMVVGGLFGGCAAERRPLVLIEPEYSYLRDGELFADADFAVDAMSPIELADAPSLLDGVPVELTEPSLLRPAKSLVQVEAIEAQPQR